MTRDEQLFEIKLKAAFKRAKVMESEWMSLAVQGNLLYGWTTEQIKTICLGDKDA